MTTNDPTGALSGEFHPADINEGPPPLPQRIAGATLPPAERDQVIAQREAARLAREESVTGRPFQVGDIVLAAGLYDAEPQTGPIIMIHTIKPSQEMPEGFRAAYVEVDKSLPETDPKRLVQVFLTADATGPLDERHHIGLFEPAEHPAPTNPSAAVVSTTSPAVADVPTPSLVELDRSDAADRMAAAISAALADRAIDGIVHNRDLRQSLADYRAAVAR